MSNTTVKQNRRKPTKTQLLKRVILVFTLWALFGLGVRTAINVFAAAPATPSFNQTWQRTDLPVLDGQVNRTWMWGEDGNTPAMTEAYADAPNGARTVQYFDKSRMEDNSYRASAPWDVTNGLLVVELITGRMQVGDDDFVQYSPANVNVAGDQGVAGVEYATLASLLDAPALADGATITQRLDQSGNVTSDPALASYGVTAAERVTVPGLDHQIASPFWTFMNSSGTVYENGVFTTAPMFPNAYYATGYPITEAYWANVQVAGVYQDVLLQCFERRCLTYTPGNAAGWQVEAGNVGQHYYAWRYQQIDDEQPDDPTPTPPDDPTPTPPEEPTPTPTEEVPDPVLEYTPFNAFGELWDPNTTLGYVQGLAVSGGYVYVAEQNTNRVTVFTTDGSYVDAWEGFNNPGDVEVDRDGNVWVSDTNNHVVKKFSPDGTFLTQIGTGAIGCAPGDLAAPDGLAFTSNGHILVSDYVNDRIARFNAAGVYLGALGDPNCISGLGNNQFHYPHDVDVDANDNIYVVDSLNDRVVKFNAVGDYIEEWGKAGGLPGNLPGEFDGPFGIAISPDGYAYVADSANDRVQALRLDGTPAGEFGAPGTDPGQFGEILAIEIDTDGSVYVGDFDNANVQKFGSRGAFIARFTDNRYGRLMDTPYAMTLDADGNVYVADEPTDRILKFDATGNFLLQFGEFATGPARFDEPSSMAASPDGYLYVLDAASDRVLTFTQDGQFVVDWGQTGNGNGEFITPHGIEVDDAGNVYVADTGNDRIQKFTSTGVFVPEWDDPSLNIDGPTDIAIHGEYVYVVERDNHRVQRFTLDGAPLGQWGGYGTLGGGQLNGPFGIATDMYGYVYVADTGNDLIQKFAPDGTFLAEFGNTGGPAQLDTPRRVELDENGRVYILDSGNYRVMVYGPLITI